MRQLFSPELHRKQEQEGKVQKEELWTNILETKQKTM